MKTKNYPDYTVIHGRIRTRAPDTGEPRPTDDVVLMLKNRPAWVWLAREATKAGETDTRLKGYLMEAEDGRLPRVRPVKVRMLGIGPDDLEAAALLAAGQATGLNVFFGRPGGEGETAQKTADRVDAIMALINNAGRGSVQVGRTAEGIRTPLLARKRYGISGNDGIGHRARVGSALDMGGAMDAMAGVDRARRVMRRMEMLSMPVPELPALDYEAAGRALASVSRTYPAMVEWYAGKDATGTQAGDRLQAAASYPLLAGLIATIPALREKVDSRQPIRDDLLALTGLSEAGLKRLARLRTPVEEGPVFQRLEESGGMDAVGVARSTSFFADGSYSLSEALADLASIKPEWVPQDEGEWQAFVKICRGYTRPMSSFLSIPPAEILARSKGRWSEFLRDIAAASDVTIKPGDEEKDMPVQRLLFFTSDAMQSVWDFARDVLVPSVTLVAERHGIRKGHWFGIYGTPGDKSFDRILTAARSILLGRSKNPPLDLLRLGRSHSTRLLKIAATWGAEKADPKGEAAPVSGIIAPPVAKFTKDKVSLTHLETFFDMQREGEDMNHCVGRDFQLSSAHEARNIYYSVRDTNGQRSTARFTVSTREITGLNGKAQPSSVVDGATGVRICLVEHRGVGNCEPSAAHAKAVQAMLASITTEAMADYGGKWVTWRKTVAEDDHIDLHASRTRSVMPWIRLAGIPPAALDTDVEDIRNRSINKEKALAVWMEWSTHILPKGLSSPDPSILGRIPAYKAVVEEVLTTDNAEILMERMRQEHESLQKEAERQAEAENDAPTP